MGKHNSDHLGVPKTGKSFAMETMHLFRAEGDRLAEHWGVRDEFSVLVQVGALTPPSLGRLPDRRHLTAGAEGRASMPRGFRA